MKIEREKHKNCKESHFYVKASYKSVVIYITKYSLIKFKSQTTHYSVFFFC